MMGPRKVAVAAAGILATMLPWSATANAQGVPTISAEGFEHRFVARELPNRVSWGYMVSALADFNGDGRLDYATGVRGGEIYWFENRKDGTWRRHVLAVDPITSLGSTALDIDGDGHVDLVLGRYWYRNPGPPHDRPFTRYEYDSRVGGMHDVVAADVSGNGRTDVVVLDDKHGAFWYEIPDDPNRDTQWRRHTITMNVLQGKHHIHGGPFPRGVADLTGNGQADVVASRYWYENRNGGREWIEQPLPFGQRGMYGLSVRSWVVDLNGNGRNDIVIVDCDQDGSEAAWLENQGGSPPTFKRHDLPRTAPGTRGSFHSLAVADFNGNGRLDIFTVEQEDTNIFPKDAAPRWYIWENMGGAPPRFEERVILDARLGGHDALVADLTGNGKPDIITKVWRPWRGNANDGREHVDLLINRIGD